MGPRTGRGAGSCTGFGQPGYLGRGRGWGFAGYGRGRAAGMFCGGGWPYGAFAAAPAYGPDPGVEKECLLRRTAALKKQLATLEKRLSELEAGGGQEPS